MPLKSGTSPSPLRPPPPSCPPTSPTLSSWYAVDGQYDKWISETSNGGSDGLLQVTVVHGMWCRCGGCECECSAWHVAWCVETICLCYSTCVWLCCNKHYYYYLFVLPEAMQRLRKSLTRRERSGLNIVHGMCCTWWVAYNAHSVWRDPHNVMYHTMSCCVPCCASYHAMYCTLPCTM